MKKSTKKTILFEFCHAKRNTHNIKRQTSLLKFNNKLFTVYISFENVNHFCKCLLYNLKVRWILDLSLYIVFVTFNNVSCLDRSKHGWKQGPTSASTYTYQLSALAFKRSKDRQPSLPLFAGISTLVALENIVKVLTTTSYLLITVWVGRVAPRRGSFGACAPAPLRRSPVLLSGCATREPDWG